MSEDLSEAAQSLNDVLQILKDVKAEELQTPFGVWIDRGEYFTLRGHYCSISLQKRPGYCDRGDWVANMMTLGPLPDSYEGAASTNVPSSDELLTLVRTAAHNLVQFYPADQSPESIERMLYDVLYQYGYYFHLAWSKANLNVESIDGFPATILATWRSRRSRSRSGCDGGEC